MAAPYLVRNSCVLAKVESTYNTDSVPTVGSNAIEATQPNISVDATLLERNIARASLSNVAPVIGKTLVNVNFNCELKSEAQILDGGSGAPINIDPILQASGFTPTYTAETSGGANDGYVTYAPNSAPVSATFYVFPGKEVRHIMTGSYVNWSIDFQAGGYAVMTVDAKGNYVAPTDTTAGSLTLPSDIPQAIESISMAFGAVTAQVIRGFTIALNNEIIERADVNSANGLKGFRIAARRPTLSFKIEKMAVATWNIYAALRAATSYATTFTIGSVAGKKILVTIPKLVLTSIKESEDSGIVMLDCEAMCALTTADDELTFKFF
jgi:hypothetical protein